MMHGRRDVEQEINIPSFSERTDLVSFERYQDTVGCKPGSTT